jgi:broad specificity phosphatase PhoE
MARTRILLIRHGGTPMTSEDRFTGAADIELSADGRAEVEALSRRLAKTKIDAIYSSDLRRTIETATTVGAPHDLKPIARPELREVNHGRWEGQVHKIVEQTEEYKIWNADPLVVKAPGGESGLDVLQRALPALRQIIIDHTGQTVAVVSHKATNRLLIGTVLGIDLRRYRELLAQEPACLNVIDFSSPAQGRVVVMNDVGHYDAGLQQV